MEYLLGIDLGTTNVKSVIIDRKGNYIGSSGGSYPIITPSPGWAEQDPEIWFRETIKTIVDVIKKTDINSNNISGIGLSGQMHGIVPINNEKQPLYNAIIWADQRVKDEIKFLKENISRKLLINSLGNPINSGFSAPKILWYKKNLFELYKKTYKFLLPKDYIRLKMTDSIGTDYSDASATLMLDLKTYMWSKEMIDILGITDDKLPNILNSTDIAGKVTQYFSSLVGIPEGTPVVTGGGDQPCSATGSFILNSDRALITIGTGGQLFYPTDTLTIDPNLRVHTLIHAIGNSYYIMGAIQSAGASLEWWMKHITTDLSYHDLNKKESLSIPGAYGIIFTPYLFGERTPYMDDKIRGAFLGLSFSHNREDMIRAIMEGVSFAVREAKEIIEGLDIVPGKYYLAGGILKSNFWPQILSDILGKDLFILPGEEKAGYGASLLAGLGIGLIDDIENLNPKNEKWIKYKRENMDLYDRYFSVYKKIYQKHKDITAEILSINNMYKF